MEKAHKISTEAIRQKTFHICLTRLEFRKGHDTTELYLYLNKISTSKHTP